MRLHIEILDTTGHRATLRIATAAGELLADVSPAELIDAGELLALNGRRLRAEAALAQAGGQGGAS